MDGHNEGFAPQALTTVMIQQQALAPDDSEAIERMLRLLDLAQPSLGEIRSAVCEFYTIKATELASRQRFTHYVFPRQMFCFLARRYTRASLHQIKPWVGYTDHTTVMHGVRRVARYAVTRDLVRDDIDVLRLRISEKILMRRQRFAQC